jgi:uncharacterized protein YjiS (DUF1127 family)
MLLSCDPQRAGRTGSGETTMSGIATSYGSGSGLPGARVFWRTEFERIFLRGSGAARAAPQQPAAAAPEGQDPAGPGRPTGVATPPPTHRRDHLRRLHARTVSTWLRRGRERRELLQLGDRELRDIGVTGVDVAGAAAKPFWRG